MAIRIISVKQPALKILRKFRIFRDELLIEATEDCERKFESRIYFMKKKEQKIIKMRNHNLIPTNGPDNVEFARVCTPKTKNQFCSKMSALF